MSTPVAERTEPARRVSIDRIEAERRLADVLLEVATRIATILDPKELLDRLASLTLDALGAERCVIFVGDGPDALRPATAVTLDNDPVFLQRLAAMQPVDLTRSPRCLQIWETCGSISVDDIEVSPYLPERLRRLGSRSFAVSTLRVDENKQLGLIAVDYVSRRHKFRPAEVRMLDAIAAASGIALGNARLYETVSNTADQQRRLLLGTGLLNGADAVDEVCERVAEGLVVALDAGACIVATEGNDDGFRVVASHGASGGVAETISLPPGIRTMVEYAWTNDKRRAIRVTGGRWTGMPAAGAEGDVVLLIQLSDGIERHGVALVARRGQSSMTDADVDIAEAFASEASLAIRGAVVRETLAMQVRAVEVLRRLSGAVIDRTDMRAALASINENVLAEIGYESKGITFSDRALCSLLDVSFPTEDEAKLVANWRQQRSRQPVDWSEPERRLRVGIRLAGHVAGILRLEASHSPRLWEPELLQTLADGIGDLASRAKLRRLSERRGQELAIAYERERIARDLHDTIGQLLYGLCLKSQQCLELDLSDASQQVVVRNELGEMNGFAAQGIRDMRAAVYSLSFLHVKAEGLIPSLRRLVKDFSVSTGIEAQLKVLSARRARLPEEVESALYRVAHEALTNVDRHARASFVVMTLNVQKDVAELHVRDDGVGIDQRHAPDWRSSAHFGSRMMARLIHELGGTFALEPSTPRGLLIRAVVPFKRKEPSQGRRWA